MILKERILRAVDEEERHPGKKIAGEVAWRDRTGEGKRMSLVYEGTMRLW
jgi:hypothetical protein